MKSQKVVVKIRSNSVEEFDLALHVQSSAIVVDLFCRQPRFPQQRCNIDAFVFRSMTGEPSHDPHGTQRLWRVGEGCLHSDDKPLDGDREV